MRSAGLFQNLTEQGASMMMMAMLLMVLEKPELMVLMTLVSGVPMTTPRRWCR
jgi:hypothetical protein